MPPLASILIHFIVNDNVIRAFRKKEQFNNSERTSNIAVTGTKKHPKSRGAFDDVEFW